MSPRPFGLALFGLLLAPTAQAFDLAIPGPSAPDEDLAVRAAFELIPATGYVPVEVALDNRGPATRRYRIRLEGRVGYADAPTRFREARVEIAPGEARIFSFLAPVSVPPDGGMDQWTTVDVRVTGGGLGSRAASMSNRVPAGHKSERPTVGFGLGIPDPEIHLEGAVPDDLHVVPVDPSLLSGDWRGLLGLDGLWLTRADIEQLPVEAARAVAVWVGQGGDLVLVDPEGLGPPGALPFEAEDWAAARFGAGRLVVLSEPVSTVGSAAERVVEQVRSLRARVVASEHGVRSARIHAPSALAKEIEPVEVRRGLILAVLAAFGLLIGPINFFGFAPRAKRVRLLWTTPAVSFGASLALVLVILLQDGVGGHGPRAQLVLQLPRLQAELRLQHQVSHTGLMPFAEFDLDPGTHLTAIPGEADDRDLGRAEGRAVGEWFRTRARQVHGLGALVPSRGRVVRVGGEAPALASDLAFALRRFYYVDADGAAWTGEALAPGERAPLAPASKEDLQAFVRERAAWFPGHLRPAIAAGLEPGWLVAEAAGVDALSTSDSVRWEDRPTILVSEVHR